MINSDYYFEMNEEANKCRREWFVDENAPIDIFSIVENKIKDLTIVFMDMGDNVSGASTKVDEDSIIFINSKETYARQRFNLAHELYHLIYDEGLITCLKDSDDEIEKKADIFASCLLLPHGALSYYEQVNNIKKWTINEIIDAEQYFQISHHAIMWRLRNLEKITYNYYLKYRKEPVRYARKMGYNTRLYEPYTTSNTTDGNYIKLVNKLFDDNRITVGKKDELLSDAFCEDKIWE